MSFAACLRRVSEETGIDERRIKSIADSIGRKRARGMSETQLREAVQNENITRLRQAATRKRQEALAILNREEFISDVAARQSDGASLKEAIMGRLVGGIEGVKGARRSISGDRVAVEAEFSRGLLADLQERPHVLDLMMPGPLDRVIRPQRRAAQLAFNEDVLREMKAPGSTKNGDARFVAEKMAHRAEMARIALNDAGADIGKIENWSPQGHQADAMLRAGKDDWIAAIKDEIDLERSFGDDAGDWQRILSGIYDNIVLGDPLPIGKRTANTANSLGLGRVLHFKDADAQIRYNRRFGQPNMMVAMVDRFSRSARALSLMRHMGANPTAWLDRTIAEMADDIRAREISEAAKDKLLRQLDSKVIRDQMAVLTGQATTPANATGAMVAAEIRAFQSLAKLGGAAVSAISDLSTYISNMRFNGVPVMQSLAEPFERLRGRVSPEEYRRINLLIGAGSEHMMGSIQARFMADESVPGVFTKGLESFFRLTGLAGWTDAWTAAASRMHSINLAWQTSKGWGDLDDGFKHVLGLHGIGEDMWRAIRKVNVEQHGGRGYLIPRNALDLDDAAIAQIARDRIAGLQKLASERKWSDETLTKEIDRARSEAKREVMTRLMAYLTDESSYAVLKGDDRAKALLTQGTQSGTAIGEALRMMTQFKMFPTVYTQRALGRGFRQGIARQSGPLKRANPGSLAELMATSLVLGYAAMTAKDILKNKTPRDPTRPATILAAFLQGGGAGIYGDFLFKRASRFGNSPIETLAGPTAGSAADALTIATGALHGDLKASEALWATIQNTPGANIWWLKGPLDYLIINSLAERASPGSMRRREKKMREEFGQRYIIPPPQL